MPWAQATAMINRGVPEGEAIATANKTGNRLQHRPSVRQSIKSAMRGRSGR